MTRVNVLLPSDGVTDPDAVWGSLVRLMDDPDYLDYILQRAVGIYPEDPVDLEL